ncbi:MAG: putative glycoside hydrolase, partial [Holosporales bacterium]|nr:putative glycoside hydrolase [Holosporales bacterium]
KEGSIWLNPYDKRSWEYIVNIAKKAAEIGFDEIQFDYVRFSPYKNENIVLGNLAKTVSKIEIINQFFDYAIKELHPLGVKVSVDAFGCIIPETLGNDTKISSANLGQDYISLAKKVDYICPMIYPSHWPIGSLGTKYPDLAPYQIVYNSMKKAIESSKSSGAKAIIRPWAQAFTASWLQARAYQKYTKKQINEQIKAVYDVGLIEWSLWNPRANYDIFVE